MVEGLFTIFGLIVGSISTYLINKKNYEQQRRLDLEKWEKEKEYEFKKLARDRSYEILVWKRNFLIDKIGRITTMIFHFDIELAENKKAILEWERSIMDYITGISVLLDDDVVNTVMDYVNDLGKLGLNYQENEVEILDIIKEMNKLRSEVVIYLKKQLEKLYKEIEVLYKV